MKLIAFIKSKSDTATFRLLELDLEVPAGFFEDNVVSQKEMEDISQY